MKIVTITTLALSVLFYSCGSSKAETAETSNSNKEETTQEHESVTTEVSKSGEDIFTSNGCVACHQVDTKTVGPSVKEISTAYSGNKDGLNKFFIGEGAAIVDPAQEAIMKPQTEVTKAMSDEDRSALADYILNN